MKGSMLENSAGATVRPVVVVIWAMAIVSVFSLSTDVVRAKSSARSTASNVTETDNPIAAASNQGELKAAEEPAQPVVTESGTNKVEPSDQAGGWKIVRMRVTAYCPCAKCCGKHADGVTACGHKIMPGDVFVAADKRFSFGTQMIIDGYGKSRPVSVLDRGGAIRGNKLDVFFHTHSRALEWGVRNIDVKVQMD